MWPIFTRIPVCPHPEGAAVAGDNPIRRPEDDAFGRADVARSFAQQLLSLDAREGAVVGVLGAWGTGKTSFINLARGEFDRASVPVLDFNPWMFSGTEQLVESFFVELSAQLKMRPGLAQAGKDLEEYGEIFSGWAWLPFVGSFIEGSSRAAKILGKILQRRKEGIGGLRAKLERALRDLDRPVVVVLDDIDRLSTAEIRDVFKLVRLTASFPNIVYVVAFDRKRVEDALGEQGVPGRDYLEKILQVVVDLPTIPAHVLHRQVFSALDRAISGVENPGPFDDQAWPDLFAEIVRPLIRTMRDVRRYAAAVHGTIRALRGEVALADVLALEAVRVFLPDVFSRLPGAVDGLTTTSGISLGRHGDPPELKTQVDGLIEAAQEHSVVARAMIDRLFPASRRHLGSAHYGAEWKAQWLRERRVAHEDLLRLYLERVAGEGLQAFKEAEQAWPLMTDRQALERYFRSLDPARLQDVIASLEVFENEFNSSQVVPTAIVLLNLLPDLPNRSRGMFDLDTRMVVTRVVYRLVRSLKEPDRVEAAVHQILPEVTSLSSKLELIEMVGYREEAGHELVSEPAAAELERAWRTEVRSATVGDLVKERDLFKVLWITKEEADPNEMPLEISNSPDLTLVILRAARSETRSQTVGSRALRRSPRLDWDALVSLYGDEDTLKRRIDVLKANQPEGADDLLELADKYLGGWRPGRFDS